MTNAGDNSALPSPLKKVRVVEVLYDQYGSHASKVVLNVGAENGISPGDEFLIYGLGKEIIDVDGRSLGPLELVRGQGIVVHVQPKLCTVQSVGFQPVRPRRKSFAAISALQGVSDALQESAQVQQRLKDGVPFEGIEKGDQARLLNQ